MTANQNRGRALAAVVPVVLVNTVAFAGQLAFLRDHLPWSLPGQVVVALALESIAVYLAYHAHVAQLANDSALRLRLGAYAFALVIAAMNYSHYAAPGWRPTFPAVAFALMSAASPWLWAVHSRRASRDALMAKGLVEPHALRLGPTRWLWHPLRSAQVMWMATWEGLADPREAVTKWETTYRESAPESSVEDEPVSALEVVTVAAPESTPEGEPEPLPESARKAIAAPGKVSTRTRPPRAPHKRSRTAPITGEQAEQEFMSELASGAVPSLRQIRSRMHVGPDRAKVLHDHLESVLGTTAAANRSGAGT